MQSSILKVALAAALSALAMGGWAASTADNLKTAYKGETTAVAKYIAFARQAEDEGYAYVATLFRAASEAEQIHARNHKVVLAKEGIAPVAGFFAGPIESTKKNLENAIKGETYERDTMYPAMLSQAKVDKNHDAVRSIVYALNAEGSHAELYKEALKQVDQGKKDRVDTFFVCPRCGETFRGMPPSDCPVCATPSGKFLKVEPRQGG